MEKLKISYYVVANIFFDKIKKQTIATIFSPRSGMLLSLSRVEWEKVQDLNLSSISTKALQLLKKAKILISKEDNELAIIMKENKDLIKKNSSNLYLVIQPSASCPFGCHYCGQKHTSKNLSHFNQELLIERIERKILFNKPKRINISWFGAEPLVGLKVIENLTPRIQLLAKKYSLPLKFSMVSNGLLLNKEISNKLIKDLSLGSIEITLDGDKEFHDKRRYLKTGGGTFDKLYNNIKYFLSIKPDDVSLTIRCNTDERNKKGVSPLLKKLAKDGLHKKISYFYVAPIHSWGNEAHKLAAEKEKFAEWEIEWLLEMQELGFNVNFLPSRRKNFCITMVPGHELIDPSGGIYNCTEVSLVPSYEKDEKNKYEVGKISNTNTLEKNKRNLTGGNFFDKGVIKNYACHTCKIFPICGGACPKEWVDGRIPCPPIKFNVKEKMMLEYAKYLKKVEKRNLTIETSKSV